MLKATFNHCSVSWNLNRNAAWDKRKEKRRSKAIAQRFPIAHFGRESLKKLIISQSPTPTHSEWTWNSLSPNKPQPPKKIKLITPQTP